MQPLLPFIYLNPFPCNFHYCICILIRFLPTLYTAYISWSVSLQPLLLHIFLNPFTCNPNYWVLHIYLNPFPCNPNYCICILVGFLATLTTASVSAIVFELIIPPLQEDTARQIKQSMQCIISYDPSITCITTITQDLLKGSVREKWKGV